MKATVLAPYISSLRQALSAPAMSTDVSQVGVTLFLFYCFRCICNRLFNMLLLANDGGHFSEELAPVSVKVKGKEQLVDMDEHPRPQTTLEGIAKLPALFKKNGVVSAGSASVSN
jgi:Acetyl-CoA acetyltransferase